jgi:hypothetical protein
VLKLRIKKLIHRHFVLGRAICFAADWTPARLLIGCISLLRLFEPYAHILRTDRTLSSASEAWHCLDLDGLVSLATTLGTLGEPFTKVYLWQSLICVFPALALFIIARGVSRYKRA